MLIPNFGEVKFISNFSAPICICQLSYKLKIIGKKFDSCISFIIISFYK